VSLAIVSDAEHTIAAGLLAAYLGSDVGRRVHAGVSSAVLSRVSGPSYGTAGEVTNQSGSSVEALSFLYLAHRAIAGRARAYRHT
jgi:hypothetical protein